MSAETLTAAEPAAREEEAVRLPLWRNALDKMRRQGVDYGKTYTAEWMEKELRCARDTMEYGLAVSHIRKALEHQGFCLTGRGQGGEQLVILPPQGNAGVMEANMRMANKLYRRTVIIGVHTRTDLMREEDRARHERTLDKAVRRLQMLNPEGGIKQLIEMARRGGGKQTDRQLEKQNEKESKHAAAAGAVEGERAGGKKGA